MTPNERERRSRNLIVSLILIMTLGYGAFKFWHISQALEAWDGQTLEINTSGAAR